MIWTSQLGVNNEYIPCCRSERARWAPFERDWVESAGIRDSATSSARWWPNAAPKWPFPGWCPAAAARRCCCWTLPKASQAASPRRPSAPLSSPFWFHRNFRHFFQFFWMNFRVFMNISKFSRLFYEKIDFSMF